MKITAIALTAVALFTAGAASASERVSDLDYLKASRCKGLATGLGADSSGLDAFLKEQSRSRTPLAVARADDEMARGKRDAKKSDTKDRMSAELSGPCMAYSGAAVTGSAKDASSSR